MSEVKEYVIYVRKSTEDNSGERQAQSIPDQIKKCIEYIEANKETMKLRLKPENFSDFESDEELRIEDNDKIIENRKIYQSTRKYYIIKERKSAHELGRPKWNKLIEKIRNGEIEGLLSYSPDRQARNLVDGGMIIECADKGFVDLKYTNFSFEPTSSGMMMLGIWFVFSKQYSDKLREDSGRGVEQSIKKGILMGEYKYGYIRNPDTGYAEPHPKYFKLMKEAFRMKVIDKASDKVIADRLNDNGFIREKRKGKEKKLINPTMLSEVRIDPFYCGIYVYGKYKVDLLDVAGANFQPMISRERHEILLDRRLAKVKRPEIKDQKRKYEEVISFPDGMIKTTTGGTLTPYIPKIGDKKKKLEELQKTNPKATLCDIINSKHVRYEVKTNSIKTLKSSKDIKNKTLAVNQYELEQKIINSLKTIKISEKVYNEYANFMKDELKNITNKIETKRNIINMRLGKIREDRTKYIERFMGKDFKEYEEEIYQKELKKFDEMEERANIELSNLTVSERNKMVEFQIFAKMLKSADIYYQKASNVQKKKIAKLLISNLIVDSKKRLRIVRKPQLNILFGKNSDSLLLAGIEPASNP